MWYLKKNGANEHIYKTERVTNVENKLMVTKRGKQKGGINWETEIDTYTLLYKKQITSRNLLYNTGTLLNTL